MNKASAAQSEGRNTRINATEKAAAFVSMSSDMIAKQTAKAMQPEPEAAAKAKTYLDFLFDMTREQVKPDFRLSVQGVEFMPSGSITAVTGWAKQGKTQWLVAMAAVMLSGRNFGTLKRGTPPKCLLWVDTEQSQYSIHKNMTRLYEQAGIEPGTASKDIGLHILSLRPCSPEERSTYIQEAIDALQPDVIVIDGIRDLLHNFNDENQSECVMQWLMNNSEAQQGRNIICVIHTNDGSDKMRGHLGTELFNKCEDRFTVEKKEGFFKVTHITRDIQMPKPFNFRIDESGHLCAEPQRDAAIILRDIFTTAGVDAMQLDEIVRRYGKEMGISQTKAKADLKEKFMGDAAEGIHIAKEGKMWRLMNAQND